MKKFNILTILVLVAMIILSACGGGKSSSSTSSTNEKPSDNQKYVLKVVHAYPSSSTPSNYFNWLNEQLEKRSNGRLSLEIYSDAQLMPAIQEVPSILNGEVDMTLSSSGVLSSFESSYYLFELPFLFDHDPKDVSVYINELRKFYNNENGGGKIASNMEKKGLKILANVVSSEPSILFTRSKETLVTDIESIKGLKIRIIGGKLVPGLFNTIGASGVPVPAAELNTALQQGLVDGSLSPAKYAMDTKMPAKTATFLPLTSLGNPVLISQEKFDSLPSDLQEILVEAGKELENYSDEFMKEHYPKALKDLEKEGIQAHYPTKEELQEWKKATLPVWEEFSKTVEGGKELLEAAQDN